MTLLQQEAADMINTLPDDSVRFVIEMMRRMVTPVRAISDEKVKGTGKRFGAGIGIMNDPDGFDEMNSDVLNLFDEAGYL